MQTIIHTTTLVTADDACTVQEDAAIGQPGLFEINPALAEQGCTRIEALHTRWHGKENARIRVGLAAHCRCMTPEEERLLGASGAAVAFNAAIAARRGLSPRIADLEAYGCTIVLGTDNMSEDMVEVMRTALFMERVRRQDGRHPTPEEVFRWATRHGYAALGVAHGGWLGPGNKADLIIVDLRRAHLVPLLRVVSCFVHRGQARDVEAVMVDGRWVMREGTLLTVDEAAIVQEADP